MRVRHPHQRTAPGGFTLVEVLIVLLVMGVIATAISSLYISTQRTAGEQLNVSDVQANLRTAMNRILKDVRMAGFMITGEPIDTRPAAEDGNAESTSSRLIIQTAAVTGNYGRIVSDTTAAGSSDTLTLASEEMAGLFGDGAAVRIIRPPLLFQPQDAIFTVTGTSGAGITLSGLNPSLQIKRGDIVVATRSGAPLVHRIEYWRQGDSLMRRVNGGTAQFLARNIANLQFTYIDDPATGLVQAVDIALTGSTTATATAGAKLRTLTSRATVRNL